MKISEHADNTKKLIGHLAIDVHKWIDGFFDYESFSEFLVYGENDSYDPYEHRRYRHCHEALEDAYKEFEGKYSRKEIKIIFESHIKDDYDGYIPRRSDFINGTFKEKYHESETYNHNERILNKEELSKYFQNKRYSEKNNLNKSPKDFLFKIIMPTIAAILLFVYLIFFVIIPKSYDNMLKVKKEMVKELTVSASSIIEYYIKLSKTKMPKENAKQCAVDEIKRMRYGVDRKNYFWITDMKPKMIMHPINSSLEGKDLSSYVDKKSGKKLFLDFVNLIKKEKEGFLEYNWQKSEGESKTLPKLSFVRGVPEWNWIIGTGIYLDDVELEMQKITQNMIYISSGISIVLLLILYYIALQSHNIEKIKQQAERGLLEAKNRYRALVEASNEGYILEVNGKNVYCNNIIKRMLGYSDEELTPISIWAKLLPDTPINETGKKHLKELFLDHTNSMEFEAQLKTKQGTLIDVILTTSRIFFHNENGHLVSVRQIVNKKEFIPQDNYYKKETVEQLINEIQTAKNDGHIIQTINHLPYHIRLMLDKKESFKIRELVGNVFEEAANKFIESSIKELGKPPCEFAFISLGSQAREEMTMFSDQDNAIVFADSDDFEKHRMYFLRLADRVCFSLNNAGYQYCSGGIMAVNPAWCLSLKEWKQEYAKRIVSPDSEAILDINIIFDIHKIYGNPELFFQLQDYFINATDKNPQFINNYVLDSLNYKVPLNIFGAIKSKESYGVKCINIKDCLTPIVLFARLYSISEKIKDIGTIQRLKKMYEKGVIKKAHMNETIEAFDYLWYLRFYNQIICRSNLRTVNDDLELSQLSTEEVKKLKETLSKISYLNTKISYDFLGVASN